MGIESHYWKEIMHPHDLVVLNELEDIFGTFNLQSEEDMNFAFHLISSPGLFLDPDNHITGINLFGREIKDLNKITDALKKLPRLVTLYLPSTNLHDLKPLSILSGLQVLDISSNNIIDLKPLSSLKALRKLECHSMRIYDLRPLARLLKLEFLGADHNRISNLTPLSQLTRLQTLLLNQNHIDDLTPLTALTELKNLELGSNWFKDITPLSGLTNLQTLKLECAEVADITPLSKLLLLQDVDLSSTNVTDLTPLANARKLQRLEIRSTGVTSLAPLLNHIEIKRLELSDTGITYIDEQLFAHFPQLKYLVLAGSPIENIPQGVLNANYNCLRDVQNYFKDSKRGQTASYEAKIILIGNGRVGKTSLVKRWLDNTFNAEEPSTHAIQLRPWLVPELAKQLQLQNIRLNIWDFGGQDIYHATHRTFMHTEAVFLLVWDAQTETIQEIPETLPGGRTIKYKNYPLEYWLSYIKVLSNNSPVIIVQTHRNRDKAKINTLTEVQQKEYNVKAMLAIESSAATANGFEALKEHIQEIVVEQIQHTCTNLPASWVNVRNGIAQLHEEQQVRQLSLSKFEGMCHKQGLDTDSMQTLLRYFHNTGVFFYREGLFNDQIVIDQKWAIDAVYTLFDRKGYFARLHTNGRFSGKDLKEYWQQYPREEQELFVSFMEQCEICFEASRTYNWNTPLEEKEFIAPQLLPEAPPLSVQALRRHGDGLYYKYRHRFLHSAIIQRFIVRTGYMANENDMWQSGIVLNTKEGMALIEAFPQRNEIVIRLDTISQRPLLNMIRNEMDFINGYEADIEELVSLDGINFVGLNDLKKRPKGNESIQAENGNWLVADKLAIFLDISQKELFTKKKRIKIPQLLKVRAELQKEVNNKCPFCPNEDVGHFEIHHIDENPGNNEMSNLLLVCPTCHSKITKGDIQKKVVLKKKKQLTS
jgi:Leucine-rich repeat (LRR) protein